MISICLTKFNNRPWENVMMEAFKEALSNIESFCKVEEIYGYPKKKYDIIILVGIRLIPKMNLDKNKIVPFCKKLIDMGDSAMDSRRNQEDAYLYFLPSKKKLYKHYHYLPKFVLEKKLYPSKIQNKMLNVYVDHFHSSQERDKSIRAINKIFTDIKNSEIPLNVFYHTSKGIEINKLTPEIPKENISNCELNVPFETISKFYRKTDVFFPTHRESQGMLAQEIGACGGLTVLQDWMYPKEVHHQFPAIFYTEDQKIDFRFIENILKKHTKEEMRIQVLKYCGFQNFKIKLHNIIKSLFNK